MSKIGCRELQPRWWTSALVRSFPNMGCGVQRATIPGRQGIYKNLEIENQVLFQLLLDECLPSMCRARDYLSSWHDTALRRSTSRVKLAQTVSFELKSYEFRATLLKSSSPCFRMNVFLPSTDALGLVFIWPRNINMLEDPSLWRPARA